MSYTEALQLFGFTNAPDAEMLDKQYKKLMRKWHPDISKEPNAAEISSKLNVAYDVIKKGTNRVEIPQTPKFQQFTHESIFRIVRAN